MSQTRKILFFIQFPQDFELLFPLMRALAGRGTVADQPAIQPVVVVVRRAADSAPRMVKQLTDSGIMPILVWFGGVLAQLQPNLSQVAAVVTASESSAPPHKAAHALVKRAQRQGIRTYTLQHGFETVGLNYHDETYPRQSVQFASEIIFTWGPPSSLPDWLDASIRCRCLPVGHIQGTVTALDAASGRPSLFSATSQTVAIFENLHWQRYSPAFRARFVQDCQMLAEAFPNVNFLVKPHPVGAWLTAQSEAPLAAPNITVLDPQDPQSVVYTAAVLLSQVQAAITTPSTVAVDAVQVTCPVAIAGYDLSLPAYQPLPILRQGADWQRFVQQALDQPNALAADRRAFRDRYLLDQDPVPVICDLILTDSLA